ncbi:BA14K family protein [Mesorhizobium sp. VK4C]|uniref:BA14K family protein n=1 Tax=Mesorhizobium captivum TaxID=3072319 RepID=UPI002A24803B|nr:BA14K family protein [Mesorhizobium sp. VK4C]MDX8500836.1 BA14K family protein [Mesorhizobium sp. VK4C]
MKKLMSGLLASVLAVSTTVTTIVSAEAAAIYIPKPQGQTVSSDIQNVESRRWRGHNRIYRRHGHNYWRGHRGYRHYRPGYRRHGDLWFPLAAFAAGAIISGAIANSRPAYAGNAHVRWCYNRYRSYRASDNTYQPYNGPRRQCVSPY